MKTPPVGRELSAEAHDRVIQMAWEDRTPFDAIELQFGLNESAVIALMRSTLKRGSFNLWRERVTGRKTKHAALRGDDVTRFKSYDQKG
jgi:uncharacterized protein (TIGR03643 family)